MIFAKISPRIRASFAASCVAILFGLDTGSIGSITTMPSFHEQFGKLSSISHGAVVSSILLTGAFAALFAGILADRFGCVRIIAIGSFCYGLGAAIECSSQQLSGFIFGRLVAGCGEGLFLSNIYVQVSEMAPSQSRGVLTAFPQFLVVIGTVMGYFMCYGCMRLNQFTLSWRVPLAVASMLGFLLSTTYWLIPPSPRWLVKHKRKDEAAAILLKLGFSLGEQEQILSQPNLTGETSEIPGFIWQNLVQMVADFCEAFSTPYWRKTALGCFLMAMQQFSGIDGVLYYAPLMFRQAGLDSQQASFLASGVSSLAILAVTIPATLLADRWGRRTSNLVGGVAITSLMVLMGSLYAARQVNPQGGAGKWIVIVSIYLFAITFNGTWALSFRTFLVESLPNKTRHSASSLAQSANWLSNYTVALITPVLLSQSSFGAYFLFAGTSLCCTIVICVFMRETRGYTLEEIERSTENRPFQSISKGWVLDRTLRVDAARITS